MYLKRLQAAVRANTQTELNGHTALNASVSYAQVSNGSTTSEGSDSVEPDEPTPSQVGVSDGFNPNSNTCQNPNHLHSCQECDTTLPINEQLGESSEADNRENPEVEDGSPDSTAEEFPPFSPTSQPDNSERNPGSSTYGLPTIMNFIKPGVPLLLSLGVLGCLFTFSWLANWCGVNFHLAGELPKAQFFYSWALKLNPFSTASRYSQGVLYEDQGNYQRARTEYQRAIEGGSVEAYNNQARLYIREGNYDVAFTLLNNGLPLAKDKRVRYDMLKNLGWVRLEQHRYAEAKVHLSEAIQLKSDRAPAYCLLAQVLEGEADKKGAQTQWENCFGYAYQPNTPEEDNWINLARQRLDAQVSMK